MNKPVRSFLSASLAAAFALATAGCFQKTPPASFYMLEAEAAGPVVPPAAGAARLLIGVGPVKLPGYLDRPQIVVGTGAGQFRLNEFHRWSEPLGENFTAVLAANLRHLLPSADIVVFPWKRPLSPDYQVEITVDQFHLAQNGQVVLEAQWLVSGGSHPPQLRTFSYAKPVAVPKGDQSFVALVAEQSAALAALSRDVAGALSQLRKP